MIIDKKGRLFGKLNILDIIIILVLVAAICLGAIKLLPKSLKKTKEEDKKTTDITYTIEVTKETADYFKMIRVGDHVFHKGTQQYFGTIVACDVTPSLYGVENKDNLTFGLAEVEGRFDGKIKIKTEAEIKYPDVLVYYESVKIGKYATCRTEHINLSGYIVDFDCDFEAVKLQKPDEEDKKNEENN